MEHRSPCGGLRLRSAMSTAAWCVITLVVAACADTAPEDAPTDETADVRDTSGSGGLDDPLDDPPPVDDDEGIAPFDEQELDDGEIQPPDDPVPDDPVPDDEETASLCDELGELGCPCEDGRDCLSGFCVPAAHEDYCTERCTEECSDPTYECRTWHDSGGDVVSMCFRPLDVYCHATRRLRAGLLVAA